MSAFALHIADVLRASRFRCCHYQSFFAHQVLQFAIRFSGSQV